MTNGVRSGRKDSVLAHCFLRAVVEEKGGAERVASKYGAGGKRLSKWAALRSVATVTPKASRVAVFIVMWAFAMKDEGADEYSISRYQRFWNEGERQTYRLQKEFRDLWPEFKTPNELARQILNQIDKKIAAGDVATLPSRVTVTARVKAAA